MEAKSMSAAARENRAERYPELPEMHQSGYLEEREK